MGKEWLQWVIGGGGGGGGKGRYSTRKGRKDKMEEAAATTSAGCMCAVLQIFDLNHFQIPLNQQHSSGFDATFLQEEDTTTFKGLEAPRNSLELDEHSIKVGSMSLCKKGEENLNFRVGIINHIKTRHEKISSSRISTKSRIDDISSECSSTYSPGTKTPTLVARLMGLDLLPETTPSPSFSTSNSKPKQNDKNVLRIRSNRTFSDDDISVGARSLPETPRISSARRSDVEYPRLSLQINKENGLNEEISSKRGSRFRGQDENYKSSFSSPRHFAKQIVSQVKESLSRRVGLSDITNTNNRRDENLILLSPTKKNPKVLSNCEITPIIEPSCSPKLRFLETNKNKPLPTNSNTKNPNISVKKSQEITIPLKEQQKGSKKIVSLKKLPHQASDHAIRNKKEDLFANKVEKKAKKKTPLISNEIVNISGPTILPVNKDPSPPATKLPQKQSHVLDALSSKRSTQLSCNSSHPYKQLQLHSNKIFTTQENAVPNGCATTPHCGGTLEYENYIQGILKRTGITDRATPLTLAKWHTLSHPLDPSIFHYLELFHPSSASGGGGNSILSRRCNRKLIFQLVDELLAEILRPHLDFKPWVSPITIIHNFTVVDELCKRIANFPAKNCEVLEDIDALIDKDLCKLKSKELLVEEWERIVCEIEDEIFESLLRETVAVAVTVTVVRTAEGQRQRDDSFTWASFT